MSAAEAFAAILAMLSHVLYEPCIARRREEIIADADAASREHGVPVRLLLAVGLMESHWGCAPASGGCWGAPRDRDHRHSAGRASHAASALALGHRRCRTWRGAVSHFRCGMCVCQGRERYVTNVLRIGGER